MVLIDKIKSIIKINHRVIKAEAEEIVNLSITQEDEEQANRLSVLIAAALVSCGIPCGVLSQQIMAKVLAYALRDIKDGIEVNDKLIIGRVINEIKREKNTPNDII